MTIIIIIIIIGLYLKTSPVLHATGTSVLISSFFLPMRLTV